jgi:hypothetical protein
MFEELLYDNICDFQAINQINTKYLNKTIVIYTKNTILPFHYCKYIDCSIKYCIISEITINDCVFYSYDYSNKTIIFDELTYNYEEKNKNNIYIDDTCIFNILHPYFLYFCKLNNINEISYFNCIDSINSVICDTIIDNSENYEAGIKYILYYFFAIYNKDTHITKLIEEYCVLNEIDLDEEINDLFKLDNDQRIHEKYENLDHFNDELICQYFLNAKKYYHYVLNIIKQHNIPFWVIWGSLLSLYRDSYFLLWDDDIDIQIDIGDNILLFNYPLINTFKIQCLWDSSIYFDVFIYDESQNYYVVLINKFKLLYSLLLYKKGINCDNSYDSYEMFTKKNEWLCQLDISTKSNSQSLAKSFKEIYPLKKIVIDNYIYYLPNQPNTILCRHYTYKYRSKIQVYNHSESKKYSIDVDIYHKYLDNYLNNKKYDILI